MLSKYTAVIAIPLLLLQMLPAAAIAAAQDPELTHLKCRSLPNAIGLVTKIYADRVIVDVECQVADGGHVGNTTLWHRTADHCYVSDKYFQVPAGQPIASCQQTDSAVSCQLPNSAGVTLIERYSEPLITHARPDITGTATIGFGHRCVSQDCNEVPVQFPLRRPQALALLLNDVRSATGCLREAISGSVSLGDNQWSALASWAYGIDCSMVSSSRLIARLNAGEPPATVAAAELPRWVVKNGIIDSNLSSRRAEEVALFQTPSTKLAHPKCASFFRMAE
ncbi:hypothetical protein LPJ53_003478 [Coemansia erecta]|uniref:Lysozyme n=1 Tax=Coemansia erecta TaxID=147472 RepID=A0A9W7XW66_9FUNG|nr:hypothetical protein LPJ53_003478 [Coemansia erecta]